MYQNRLWLDTTIVLPPSLVSTSEKSTSPPNAQPQCRSQPDYLDLTLHAASGSGTLDRFLALDLPGKTSASTLLIHRMSLIISASRVPSYSFLK
jgi:hypothetical protein